jgi:hypothetical protein
LSAAEQKSWRAIVDAAPGGFIDGAGQLLLRQVVGQIALADQANEHLRQHLAAGDLSSAVAVGKEHREMAKGIAALMGALRATPKSKVRPRDAGRMFDRSPSGPRPWDRDGDGDKPA